MKKNTITLIMAVVLTLITGAIAYYTVQSNKSKADKSSIQPKIVKPVSSLDTKEITDTTTAKHTIVIENVDDPRQLQEILTLLESYSAEHEIKDLNITTNKDKILK